MFFRQFKNQISALFSSRASRRSSFFRNLFIAFLIWLIGGFPTLVFALPQDGQIVEGSGSITTPTATSMQVDQNTNQMIVNWQSFSTAATESVNFSQPSTSSIVLNRVVGTDPSLLLGTLTANGQVFISNGSGVFFGPGSQVDTHGLIATTMAISNQDFLDRNYNFTQDIDNPLTSVINEGNISATSYVGLLAPAVENRGTIVASLGSVDLAAGKAATLDFTGDGLIQFEVTESVEGTVTDKDGNVLQDRVSNTGLIQADGGQVRMSAKDAGDVIRHVVNMEGTIEANTVVEKDGRVFLMGGGSGVVNVSGTITAKGDDSGEKGGTVHVQADRLLNSGTIVADGDNEGGVVTVIANKIQQSGSIEVDGLNGTGGSVDVAFTDNYIAMEASQISATSNGAEGGSIEINGGSQGKLFTSGSLIATSTGGIGGSLELFGEEVLIVAARLDASGDNGGGSIHIGGDYQGQGTVPLSNTTTITASTTIKADALTNGNGGEVVVWSEGETEFFGSITARGGSTSGNGGTIEVSGKGNLSIDGTTDASATNGIAGTLLLDPKDIIVSDSSGSIPFYDLVDPNANGTSYGDTIVTLANGNIVVLDINDDFGASAAGAVYLYNGATGALINSVTGTSANDQVGFGQGVTELTGGDFVISSRNWDNGGTADVGAVTLISGSLGTVVTGGGTTVTTSNSLHGTTASDQVGIGAVVALSTGNFGVISAFWDGGVVDAGAATLVSGTTGQAVADSSFVVSTSNSVHGTTANDRIGNNSLIALANGNMVVTSQTWDNGATVDAGAATLISGTTGRALADSSFVVSTSNSIHGTNANDNVGVGNAKELTNGNFIVASSSWNGAVSSGGAVTLVSGTTGAAVADSSFAVSTSNSIHGTTASDSVGSQGIIALSNGNFVVSSASWDNGGTVNAGAVTLGSGTTGSAVANSSFAVSTSNSIHGTSTSDSVGLNGTTDLGNGNFVVNSYNWNDGGTTDVGAVTLVSGSTGSAVANSSFTVSTSNSIHGFSTSDQVGIGGVIALTNGNYVVRSENWNNGGTTDVGAVTLVSGTTGSAVANSSFVVSTSNSIHGTSTSDLVGSGETIALTNGNFTVTSHLWDNGGTANVGAVTLVSGTTGSAVADSSFVVSTSNSLYGGTSNDQVGVQGMIELANSNYAVKSSLWDNGGTTDAGAVTLVSGTTGKAAADDSFIVATTNSLIGTSASAGTGVAVANNTNNAFAAQFKDNTTNRIRIGLTDTDLTFTGRSSDTFTVTSTFLTNTLDAGTAVTLQANNDITINSAIVANNAGGAGGDLTLQAGRSVLINANITTDDGNLVITANETTANGVVDADRDAGAAVITMAGSTTLNAGAGNITITMSDGTGKTNLTSGDITIDAITTTGTLSITNNGATSGSDILQNNAMTVTGTSAFTTTSDGAITLTNTSNVFTGGITLSAGTGAVSLTDTTAISLGATTFGGALTLNSNAGITFTGNITTAGTTTIDADLDNNGSGDFTVSDSQTLNTTNNTLQITANDFDLNTSGALNSGTGTTTIIISDGGFTGVGSVGGTSCSGSACGMTISNSELQNITSSGLTIGGSTSGTIYVEGITTTDVANTGTVTLNANNSNENVTFQTTASEFNALTVTANGGPVINVNLTTNGALSITGDANSSGAGNFNVGAGATITTNNNNLSVSANDVIINSTGFVNAGTGDVTIVVSDSGSIGLGDTGSAMSISGAELENITASTLTMGDGLGGGITVDNITAANSNNIGTVTLNATNTGSGVAFSNNASTFNTLNVNGGQGITFNVGVTTDTGALTLDGDQDGDGTGDVNLNSSAALISNGSNISINANDIGGSGGTINAGTGDVSITSSDNQDINVGIATGSGMFVTGAELQNITAANLTFSTALGIDVKGVTATNSDNISGTTTFISTGGTVTFSNTASTFNAISASATGNIGISVDVTTDTGNLILVGDSDNATSGNVSFSAGLTITSAGSITMDATTDGLTTAGATTFNAANGITLNDSFTSTAGGNVTIDADTDNNGTGDFTLASGAAINFSTNANALLITANDVDLSGTINNAGGALIFTPSDGGTLGLGDADCGSTCGMTLTGAEIQNLTNSSGTLVFGDSGTTTTGNIFVDNITAANMTNITGSTNIQALQDNSSVTFLGSKSFFGANVDVDADDGIFINADVEALGSSARFDADADNSADSSDKIIIADGVTLTSSNVGGGVFLDATTGGIEAAGSVTLNGHNGVTINDNFTSTGTGNITIDADVDNSGTGDFILASGTTLTTNNNDVDITADDIDLSGSIVAGTGTVAIQISDSTDIVLDGSLSSGSAVSSNVSCTGTCGMTVNGLEIQNISASNLNIGGGTNFRVIASALTATHTGGITDTISLNDTGLISTGIIFGTTASIFAGALTVNSKAGIGVDTSVTINGLGTFNADSDGNGTGGFAINNSSTLTSNSNNVNITGSVFVLQSGTTFLNAGTGDVTIAPTNGRSIGLGDTSADMQITGANLQNITAANLTIGDSTAGNITVDNISLANSANISTTLTLISGGNIAFNTAASAITNNLAVDAGGGITQGVGLSVGGTSSFTVTGTNVATLTNTANDFTGAVTLSSGTGAVQIFDAATLTLAASTLGGDLSASADNGLTINGNLTTTGNMALEGDANNSSNGTDTISLASGIIISSDGNMTLDATTNGINASGAATIKTKGSLQINDNIISLGRLTLTADSDENGVGDLTLAGGVSITTNNNDLDMQGANIDTSAFNADAGSGAATFSFTQGLTVDGAPLTNLTAGSLTIDVAGNLIVDGVTSVETTNISGLLTLKATDDVIFQTNASSHNGAVTVLADDDVEVKVDVTSGGDFTAKADNDSNGVGDFVLDTGATVTSSSGDIDIKAYEILENGTLDAFGTITRTETKPVTTTSTTTAEEEAEIDQGTNSSFLTDFTEPASSGC